MASLTHLPIVFDGDKLDQSLTQYCTFQVAIALGADKTKPTAEVCVAALDVCCKIRSWMLKKIKHFLIRKWKFFFYSNHFLCTDLQLQLQYKFHQSATILNQIFSQLGNKINHSLKTKLVWKGKDLLPWVMSTILPLFKPQLHIKIAQVRELLCMWLVSYKYHLVCPLSFSIWACLPLSFTTPLLPIYTRY